MRTRCAPGHGGGRLAERWEDCGAWPAAKQPDRPRPGSGVGLGLQDLAAAVEAARADMVTQVDLAGRRLDRDARCRDGVVRAVHAALGRRLLALLNGHENLLGWGHTARGGTTLGGPNRRSRLPIASHDAR